jgi:uncharacterized membrane protein HdeD (DUF308 family)
MLITQKEGPRAARGLAIASLGVVLVLAPALALRAALVLSGAFVLTDGVLSSREAAEQTLSARNRMWLAAQSLLGALAALLALFLPGIALVLTSVLAGLYALATGMIELIGSFRTRGARPWKRMSFSLVALVTGSVLIVYPDAGAVLGVTALGVYLLLVGALEALSAVAHVPSGMHGAVPDVLVDRAANGSGRALPMREGAPSST